MSAAFPLIQQLDCRPLTRPVFVTNEFALNSLANFVHSNYEALMNWYDALEKEIRGTSDVMPKASEFIANQFDQERARKGLPLLHEMRAIDAKYAPEREARYIPENERYANEVGIKPYGEL